MLFRTYTHGKVTVRGANWLFFIVIAAQIIVGVAAVLFTEILGREASVNYLLASTQIFAVFIPCFIYLIVKGVHIKETLRFKPIRLQYVFLSLLLGISSQYIAQMLNLPVLLLLSLLGELPPSPIEIPTDVPGMLITLGIVSILPAVFEEIMVRGIIMRAYEIRGTKTGIIISAIFFGLLHMDIKNLVGPIVFGIIFSYLVVHTGSIYAGMLAHFANNAFAVIIGYLQETHAEKFNFINTYAFVLIAFFISVVIFRFCIRYLQGHTETEIKPPISDGKSDFKAAFVNVPVILNLIIYVILLFSEIAAIVNGTA